MQLLTKQGVRDLNGPGMNGRGHNGHSGISCPHYKNPHHPTVRERRLKNIPDAFGVVSEQLVSVYLCTGCGEERFNGEER